MPQAILKYKLPDEQEEYKLALKGGAMSAALWDIANQVFRPARKHGYPEEDISKLIKQIDSAFAGSAPAEELIGLLEKKFYAILRDYEVEL